MMDGGHDGVRPALGLAWASLVGTRIMLYREDVLDSANEQEYSNKVYRAYFCSF